MTRIALVTGGSRGIGAAIVARLAADGARVIAPPRAELDLARRESIEAWLKANREPVDVLVNNAGVNVLGSADEIGAADLDAVLDVNLVAPLLLTAGLAKGMRERRWGRVVNMASVWA
ncbi:MAG TPA: SDR family NAD(P)-dependent oxidoreductase, partial [bacterium]|nr:SDR family NAD(P)-dependent oxidoreductase [bacterium]